MQKPLQSYMATVLGWYAFSSTRACSISALPSTADIHQGDGYVSFVPIGDIAMSFNYLVGAAEENEREADTKRLGGLKVDHELDLCGLLDWKVSWLCAL
jgi:hypothetical protein